MSLATATRMRTGAQWGNDQSRIRPRLATCIVSASRNSLHTRLNQIRNLLRCLRSVAARRTGRAVSCWSGSSRSSNKADRSKDGGARWTVLISGRL